MFVKPPGPRHTAVEQADGLAIYIPSKCNIFTVGFLTFWLCGWFFGEITALAGLFKVTKLGSGGSAFLLVWLTGWTIGGGFAIFIWLWQVKGREVITISSSALGIRREILGYGRTRHYDVAEIRQLRVAQLAYNPFDFRSGMAFWGIGGGAVAFDYGFKTFRFGGGIDEAEARIIVQSIAARWPSLARSDSA